MGEGLAGGAVAAAVSGAPSTLHALATGRDPLEAARAAGTLVLADDAPPLRLLAAAVPVHLALSLGWGGVLGIALPRRRPVAAGAAAGLAIAALDLGVVGRRFSRIRALTGLPQVADHLAYGAAVGFVVRASTRRSRTRL